MKKKYKQKNRKKLVVIGAGPAGLMAAGTAASKGNIDVFLVERNSGPGKKLLLTGKGRCNLTRYGDNRELVEGIPINGRFLYSAFNAFSAKKLISFIESLGVPTAVERGKRVFPVSEKASDVVRALKKYTKQNNVTFMSERVVSIKQKDEGGFLVFFGHGRRIESDAVIICTGGRSYPATGSTGDGYRMAEALGHTIIKQSPALVPLEVKEEWTNKLRGLTLKNVALTLKNSENKIVFKDFGEMWFIAKKSVSGPLVLSASLHVEKPQTNKYTISIDLKPGLSYDMLDKRLIRDFEIYRNKRFERSLIKLLPRQLIPIIVELASIPGSEIVNKISARQRREFGKLLKSLTFTVKKQKSFESSIITKGGIFLDEVDQRTMESKIIKGLYFAGEILDVTGYTGGFNLQAAFSTGFVAGRNARTSLAGK